MIEELIRQMEREFPSVFSEGERNGVRVGLLRLMQQTDPKRQMIGMRGERVGLEWVRFHSPAAAYLYRALVEALQKSDFGILKKAIEVWVPEKTVDPKPETVPSTGEFFLE